MSRFFAPIDLGEIALGQDGFVIQGEDAGDVAGTSVDSVGDLNGDGFDEVIIGASGSRSAYVVFGQAAGFPATLDLADIAAGVGGFVVQGAGTSAAAAGDVNGDGFDDFIVGAPNAYAYVVFGRGDGFPAAVTRADLTGAAGGFVIEQDEPYGYAIGSSVASAGDVNGDGFDDLIVAAPGSYSAEAYVVFGKLAGFPATVSLAAVARGQGGFRLSGPTSAYSDDVRVASAGDINGDGFDDLLVGDPQGYGAPAFSVGLTYVVFGGDGGFPRDVDLEQIARNDRGFVIRGASVYQGAGGAVAAAGDVNGDGFDDLIIGTRSKQRATESFLESNYVVFGRDGGFPNIISLRKVALGEGGFLIKGADTGKTAGRTVASAGDVNGDGLDDLIIGASGADPAGNAKRDSGVAYVVFGKAGGFGASIDLAQVALGQGGFVIQGQDAGDQAGFSVGSAGDLDGDGFDDLIVGAPFADGAGNMKANAGAAYVILGRDFGAATADLAIVATNAVRPEGDSGTAAFTFTVTRGGFVETAASATFTVTGLDAEDVATLSGTVDFAVGQTSRTIAIVVADDTIPEDDESFTVTLSDPSAGAVIVTASAAGIILNDDPIIGSPRNDTLAGSPGNDTLEGRRGDDWLGGGAGEDSIDGGNGDDMLFGVDGADVLQGGVGADTLSGGRGADTLEGGQGGDLFRFAGPRSGMDRILDFDVAADLIQVAAAGFNGLLAAGMLLPRSFAIGTASAAVAQLIYDDATGVLSWDRDGTGRAAAVQLAVLENAPGLTASDFVVVA